MVLAFTCLIAVTAKAPTKDEDALWGRWEASQGEFDGKTQQCSGVYNFTITGERFSLLMGKTLYEGTLSLGSNSRKNSIDLKVTAVIPLCRPTPYELDEQGAAVIYDGRAGAMVRLQQTWPGIYVVEEGSLKVCFGMKERPTEFTAKAESGHHLWLFEKPKKRPASDSAPPPGEPLTVRKSNEDLHREVEELRKTVEQLQKRVKELEADRKPK
jgi:uncharacterized protein (TIGR03067 family)